MLMLTELSFTLRFDWIIAFELYTLTKKGGVLHSYDEFCDCH